MAFIPVWSGWFTDFLCKTPGAGYSIGRVSSLSIGLFDFSVGSQYKRSYIVLFKVKRHTVGIAWKFQEFSGHTVFQPVNSCNTVSYLYYRTKIGNIQLVFVIFYPAYQFGIYFVSQSYVCFQKSRYIFFQFAQPALI